jgi:hypothetical protein
VPRDQSPKRRIWSASEDKLLLRLVDEHGDMRWSQIAEKMFKRNHKQVRPARTALWSGSSEGLMLETRVTV